MSPKPAEMDGLRLPEYSMKRRSFLKIFSFAAAAMALPVSIISYDPVKQEIVKPKFDDTSLIGYKGSAFLETGYVYCPYIPLYQTCNL